MKPDQILDRAADLIDERGHVKGNVGSWDEGYCAIGAIEHVDMALDDARKSCLRALRVITGDSISKWNDAPERTHKEVTSTMRDVAALLRAKEKHETHDSAPRSAF